MRFTRSLAPALLALALCGGGPASAQSFNDAQRSDIEGIIKNYLITHPEVIEDAVNELSKRQAAADQAKHEAMITQNANAIFNSPRGVTLGNKNGDVTFVEFFDYNCGYCKRAMADMLDLLKSDPKLKVVLKEFPVLSEGSVEAAKVAIAARMQDPKKYLDFHTKLLGGRGTALGAGNANCEETTMTNRFLVSVAALALIAGTGFANAQGTGGRESGGSQMQSAPSSAGGGAAFMPSAMADMKSGAPRQRSWSAWPNA